mmetsp:Transcript_25408/g.79769  ORF Transcript_25408/g.79769 Transcript_25408/m.79769 type:complete len:222 (+) Transcript_25408:75-740(+)
MRLAVLPPRDAVGRSGAHEPLADGSRLSSESQVIHGARHIDRRTHDHGVLAVGKTCILVLLRHRRQTPVVLGILHLLVNGRRGADARAEADHDQEGGHCAPRQGGAVAGPRGQLVHLGECEEQVRAGNARPRQRDPGEILWTEESLAEIRSFDCGNDDGQRAGPVVGPEASAHQVVPVSVNTRWAHLAGPLRQTGIATTTRSGPAGAAVATGVGVPSAEQV